MSLFGHSLGTARYSPDPNGNVLSPRRIKAALLMIATRRWDSIGPATNGVVSKVGQGMLAAPVRVGSGMSSSRAIFVCPPQSLEFVRHLARGGHVLYFAAISLSW